MTLWDISHGGLCLISRAHGVAIPASESLSVWLYDPLNRDRLRLRVSLSWIKQEGDDTLIGLQFRPAAAGPRGASSRATWARAADPAAGPALQPGPPGPWRYRLQPAAGPPGPRRRTGPARHPAHSPPTSARNPGPCGPGPAQSKPA
ncbi:PilZ domain-containing protein [Synechococcus sp. GreenBA-s]|nr:PilZ domain-containing protein [Synechococcus sp. GreenBA-s]